MQCTARGEPGREARKQRDTQAERETWTGRETYIGRHLDRQTGAGRVRAAFVSNGDEPEREIEEEEVAGGDVFCCSRAVFFCSSSCADESATS